MKVYLVEMWSDTEVLCRRDSCDEDVHFHDVLVAHIASTEARARKWAKDNWQFGGCDGDEDYPWHFRVRQWKIDEDCGRVVNNSNIQVGDKIRPTQPKKA